MSPKVGDWAASPFCPHPSIPSVRPSLLHLLTSPFHLQQPLRPSVRPSRSFPLPSSLLSPPCRPLSLSPRARLQPSRPCRCSRPSSWLGRPSPWHLGCGIPGTGICRGGGAGAAGAARWERPWEVKDSRQGMSIVHHRSWPGLTAPLGSGGGGGPGRAPRLLGPGPGGVQDRPLVPHAALHPCVGSGCSRRKVVTKAVCSSAAGRRPVGMGNPWDGHPAGRASPRTGIPLGWASHRGGHPFGVGLPLG